MPNQLLAGIVKHAIDKADPVGLLEKGCPDDEYNTEIKQIVRCVKRCKNAKEIQRLIYNTFVKMFDEQLAGNLEIYRKPAQEIYSALQK